jgi:altronate dehydratase large subunit
MRDAVRGFPRENGTIGIRDYLLALPSVVCSNEAARLAAEGLPDGVTFEHPVGCAQVGADKEQTWRVLVGVGSHPNVRAVMVVGLGCEGIVAETVAQGIQERGRATSVVTIQAAGGTDQAGAAARAALMRYASPGRTAVLPLSELILGVGDIRALGEAGAALVAAFEARGGRTVRVADDHQSVDAVIDYAAPVPAGARRVRMRAGTGDAETVTGLAATGAHMIVAAGDATHLGGHPVCPVVRIGYDPAIRRALQDELDGDIRDRSAEQWVDYLLEVADGRMTASEAMGSTVFAIERIGPTL